MFSRANLHSIVDDAKEVVASRSGFFGPSAEAAAASPTAEPPSAVVGANAARSRVDSPGDAGGAASDGGGDGTGHAIASTQIAADRSVRFSTVMASDFVRDLGPVLATYTIKPMAAFVARLPTAPQSRGGGGGSEVAHSPPSSSHGDESAWDASVSMMMMEGMEDIGGFGEGGGGAGLDGSAGGVSPLHRSASRADKDMGAPGRSRSSAERSGSRTGHSRFVGWVWWQLNYLPFNAGRGVGVNTSGDG